MAANNELGRIQAPINANIVVRKNRLATMSQNGAIIPFYNMFSKNASNTTPPPSAWLTRR